MLYANTAEVNIDACCPVGVPSKLHVFAARVHAHALGVVISGYKFNSKVSSLTALKYSFKIQVAHLVMIDR